MKFLYLWRLSGKQGGETCLATMSSVAHVLTVNIHYEQGRRHIWLRDRFHPLAYEAGVDTKLVYIVLSVLHYSDGSFLSTYSVQSYRYPRHQCF